MSEARSEDRGPQVFLVCGEVSGETHAVNLARRLRELRPDVRLVGFGGQRLEEAGCRVLFDLVDIAVMGISAVLKQLGTFLHVLRLFHRQLATDPPDLVVLIDYPGLNFKIAQIARAHGIPVYYYICPQLWAWGPWRLRRARRLMEKALAILPFEKPFFERHGIETEYVGHPLIDNLDAYSFDRSTLDRLAGDDPPCLGLLPGSRRQEVEANLPTMLSVAKVMMERGLSIRVAIPPARDRLLEPIGRIVAESGVTAEILPDRVYEVMKGSYACLVTSGTAVLETAYLGTPLAVLYRLTPFADTVRKLLLSVPYIASINLIARREIVPEFCGHADPTLELVSFFERLWADPEEHRSRADELDQARALYDRKGATRTAAGEVARRLGELFPTPEPASAPASNETAAGA